jgi:hypothetical protein
MSILKQWQLVFRLITKMGFFLKLIMDNYLYCDIYTRCLAMTTKQAIIKQPLLSNGSANKHVSTAMREHRNKGRDVFYTVCAEVLQPGPRELCLNLLVVRSMTIQLTNCSFRVVAYIMA